MLVVASEMCSVVSSGATDTARVIVADNGLGCRLQRLVELARGQFVAALHGRGQRLNPVRSNPNPDLLHASQDKGHAYRR